MEDQTEKGPGCGTAFLILIAVSAAVDYVGPVIGITEYLTQVIIVGVLSLLIFLVIAYWALLK